MAEATEQQKYDMWDQSHAAAVPGVLHPPPYLVLVGIQHK